MAYAAVVSLRRTIEDLVNSPRISLVPQSEEIMVFAYQEMKSLQEILKRLDNTSKSYCRKKVNGVDTRIKEAVWKFEDLIASNVSNQILPQFEIDGVDASLLQVDLQEVGEDVDSFTKMVKKMEEEYIYELDRLTPEEDFDCGASSKKYSDIKISRIVGSSDLQRETDLLTKIKWRLKYQPFYTFASIAGMGGIGKTTLAKQIFDDVLDSESEEYSFECGAWVTIGRNYRLNQLKRDILLQLDPDMVKSLTEGDLGLYLNEILRAKKCLIVLDDVWDTHVWDHLKSFFLEDRCIGVLLTTRLQGVAEYAGSDVFGVDDKFRIRLLNKDESWDLLRERVFGEELCPPELERDGKKIAENCDGLPLMIVTVAESLSKADKTIEYWNYVAENATCFIFMDAYDKISEVLFPSYEYLPQHLKPSFLHIGVFPVRYEISRDKLLNMWISERFLDREIGQTLEECAHSYLKGLLYHNVAMLCQKSTAGTNALKAPDDVKTCRLHSSFWYLCYKEAGKNKFFHVLSSPKEVSEESMKIQRRLSVHNNILFANNEVRNSIVDACASTARSLLCCGPYHPFQVQICWSLRLLRVLDALHIRFYEFPMEVLQLIHLKYLAMTCNSKLPASISKLFNLQFLIIHRHTSIKYQGDMTYVPIEIWDMQELKHIEIIGSNLPNPGGRACMENLRKLIGASAQTCTKEVLERICNLTKLGIRIELNPEDDMKALHCLNYLDVLSEVRSLTCIIVNPKLRSEIVSLPAPLTMFPSGLQKLHLSGLGYPWEYMSVIGSLPNLRVLKLRSYAFRGPKWEVKGGGSQLRQLEYLLIEDTDLVQFKVESGGFPWLGILRLKHCYKLEDLQWNTRFCPYKIELIDCSSSTATFASQMRMRFVYDDETHDRIFVHSSWDDGKV